jgi:hypothetical protein
MFAHQVGRTAVAPRARTSALRYGEIPALAGGPENFGPTLANCGWFGKLAGGQP